MNLLMFHRTKMFVLNSFELFLNNFVFIQTACANVVKLIRSSNDLSRASDHDFLMSFTQLRRRMDTIAEKVLQKYAKIFQEKKRLFDYFSMTSILRQQNLRRDLGGITWKEADHDDKMEKLIDVNDILFERIVNRISCFFSTNSI